MAKKSVKPYSSSNNRSRTLNNKKSINTNVFKKTKKSNDGDNSLENTTRIRIDSKRINDAESLDTSFLEGRLDKKARDNKKVKEKILKDRKQMMFNFEIIKWFFFSLAFLCIITLGIIYVKNSPLFIIDESSVTKNEKTKKEDKDETKNVKVEIDDNYLFVGDFYTDKLDLGDSDYHYVKSCSKDLKTSDLLNDMKKMIYDYNPSDVFIQIGSSDLADGVSIDDIASNYKKIISSIKENRTYANIYVISLYPINKDVENYDSDILGDKIDNDDIEELNTKLSKISFDNDVEYVDLYDLLNDEGKLNKEYTNDGIYLNKDGNEKVISKLKKYLDDEV